MNAINRLSGNYLSLSQVSTQGSVLILLALIIFSLITKVTLLNVGAPYVTIDDQTMYEGGFLVWFGQAPPQRMYLESWFVGISNILTYLWIAKGEGIGLNIVAEAYQEFHRNPDPFVYSYRILSLAMDTLTLLYIYRLSMVALKESLNVRRISLFVTTAYALSYNTVWCYLVARPDTPMTLFSVIGLYYYLRANEAKSDNLYWISAISLGLATGLKMHGGFFVVLIFIDRIRALGIKQAVRILLPFGLISVSVFAVSAGSPLFDPLLYVKLRLLNIKDDSSPWIQQGEQFIAILRGTGWVILPLYAYSIFKIFKKTHIRTDSPSYSLALITVGWLLLFLSIRQLRPYWMLPVIPAFYIVSAFLMVELRNTLTKMALSIIVISALTTQFMLQVIEFKEGDYEEARSWITHNANSNDQIYIFGYEAINLPKSQLTREKLADIYRAIVSSRTSSDFTTNHIKNWEERSRLTLLSMLSDIDKSENGYNYYGVNTFNLSNHLTELNPSEIDIIFVLEGFLIDEMHPLASFGSEFNWVDRVGGPGGGGKGMYYDVYRRVLQ